MYQVGHYYFILFDIFSSLFLGYLSLCSTSVFTALLVSPHLSVSKYWYDVDF